MEAQKEVSMSALASKACVPCQGGVPPLTGGEIRSLQRQLGGAWKVVDDHHLEKEFKFSDFKTALQFTNKIGNLAEAEGHHPDIALSWGKVGITLWTHTINGLCESDFILAAKIDKLAS